MKGVFKFILVEFKLFFRSFIPVFFAFMFPSMMLLMFGGIYGNKPSPLFNGHGTIDVSVPAYTVIVITVIGIMNLPLTISEYRERKILKRLMATPVNSFAILISQLMVNFIVTVIGMALLIIVGKAFYNLRFPGEIPSIIAAFVLSTLSMFSIGFLIASISRDAKVTGAVANLIYFPMLFLSGATTPVEIMPESLMKIVRCIPAYYAVHLQKGIWLGGRLSEYMQDIIILVSILTVCTLISVIIFRWE